MFVPSVYKAVEYFSDEWWGLVHSSPWLRDYCLRECFSHPQTDLPSTDIYDPALADIDSSSFDPYSNKDEEKEAKMALVSLGMLKWRKERVANARRQIEKVPKIVNVKVSPRPIHQPR